jgi:hypothetical protein
MEIEAGIGPSTRIIFKLRHYRAIYSTDGKRFGMRANMTRVQAAASRVPHFA